MKLYIHFGYPRTGTTSLQVILYPNHPQINYLGRFPQTNPDFELINLVTTLTDDDFNKRYSELLKKAKELYLDPNKINIISSEFIILHTIHYPYGNDNSRTISRALSRLNSLFSKIDIDVYFFCSIRSQSEIIPSFYSVATPELNYSLTFNGKELAEYLETKKSSNPMIKRLLDGFDYSKLYKDLSKVVEKNKIKFFLYEEFRENYDNFVSDLSNYLEIDTATSIKLLKYKSENKGINIFKENLLINSPLSVIFSKLTKNFKNPKILFHSFDKKIINMLKLLNKQISGFDKKDKEIIKIRKENLINQLNIIKNNSSLIKKYYRNSCLELKNELKLDIDKYDYL